MCWDVSASSFQKAIQLKKKDPQKVNSGGGGDVGSREATLQNGNMSHGQECIRRGGRGGGLKGVGGGGVWLGPPSSLGPPSVPAEGGPKI